MNPNSEVSESKEVPTLPIRRLETPDDIVREIADRRLFSEFSADIPSERFEKMRPTPDRIENTEDFEENAAKAGLKRTEGVLGYSTNLETPAHVLKTNVPTEISTLVHEDLHRLTDEATMRELTASPSLNELYEGLTEYFTQHAVAELHENEAGQSYPEETERAKTLANEVGEENLRAYYFRHEFAEEIKKALVGRSISQNF